MTDVNEVLTKQKKIFESIMRGLDEALEDARAKANGLTRDTINTEDLTKEKRHEEKHQDN